MPNALLTAHFHAGMSEINAQAWDAMVSVDTPHLSYAFLNAAESSGSVCEDTGWLPCHLTLERDGNIVAAMPLYQKGHSWGEFVFDWSWADAYHRSGLVYYPKLVSASPFTPATTDKFLVAPGEDETVMGRTLLASAIDFAEQHDFSSLHLHFVSGRDIAVVNDEPKLLIRKDCQFHWQNNGYSDFNDYLSHFASKKRKNVKRERRRLLEAGISHRIVAGEDITATQMSTAWKLCSNTFAVRGHAPYLNIDFFETLLRDAPHQLVLVLAEHDDNVVAAAILFRGENALYGRYWGSDGDYHSLHFETCYYQGIEYCINEGIDRYEPGTQGEHKVSRGFLPTSTYSAHWLAHPEFASAIGNYLEREERGVDAYMAAIDERSPFKSTDETGK